MPEKVRLESNSHKIKAAVVGLGIGEHHLRALLACPQVEVLAVCELDRPRLEKCKAEFPLIQTFSTEFQQILDIQELDLVVIATYDNYHCQQVAAAIQAGKHVFVEKPICQTLEEAKLLQTVLAKNPETKICSNLILRRYPRVLKAREIISAEQSRPFLLEGDYNYGRQEKLTQGWRGEIPFYSIMGGGGLHLIDAFQWLMQEEIEEVHCYGGKFGTQNSKFNYPDTMLMTGRFPSGALVKILANFAAVYPHFHKISIYTAKQSIESIPGEMRLWSSSDPSQEFEIFDSESSGLQGKADKSEILLEFVDSLLTGKPSPVSKSEIFSAMAVCFSAEESYKTGKPITTSKFLAR